MAEDKDLTIDQAAKRLDVHPNTVRNAIETGKIHARKVLGRWRIKESEVNRVLAGESAEESQEQKEEE